MDIDVEKRVNEAISQLRELSIQDIDFNQMDPVAKMMLIALVNECKKIQDYIDRLWEQFKKGGYVENPISHKRFTKNLKDMSAHKLMNYMVQSLETARNVVILHKVLHYLFKTGCKTKLELITYDSFLLDVAKGEEEVVQKVKKIMEQGGYPVKLKTSDNLNFD